MHLSHPFTADLPIGEALLKFLRGNVTRKRDTMLALTGPEGAGKSTTAGNIVQRLAPEFDVRRDTIMSLTHLLDVLERGEKGRVWLLDEAINIFHNQEWGSWESRQLSRIIRQMRIMKSTWLLCVPDYPGLHPYLRTNRVRIWLYHEPVWDSGGMLNGPAKLLWRHEWFSYTKQEVVHRWVDVGDVESENLDDDPSWAGYEEKKVQNFVRLVKAMKNRQRMEALKERSRAKKILAQWEGPAPLLGAEA